MEKRADILFVFLLICVGLQAQNIDATIARYAKEHGCEIIIMGRRGMGAIGSAIMGSVAMRLLSLTDLPVTLVK